MQINNNFQKNANISMVAHLLWRSPGISRVEIARQLDLYRSTVSNIINTLIDNGVVLEEKEGIAMPQGGRKPISLGLNEKFGCVVGVELQPSGYHAVIINVFGNVIHSCDGKLPHGTVIDIVCRIIETMRTEIDGTGLPLLGICLGMPGIIDHAKGIVVRSDPFHLENERLAKSLSDVFSVPVMIENDANCLAWLELANNRGDDIHNFLCVNAEYHKKGEQYGNSDGMGVGIGIAVDGSVYSGSRNAAGEFVSVSWKNAESGQTGLAPELMARLEEDSKALEAWVVDLFSSLVPVVSILDPEAVFAHGELGRHAEQIREIIARCVPQFDLLLKRSSCVFSFGNGDLYSVATGAAMIFFLHLFTLPSYSTSGMQELLDWETVFKLAQASPK